MNKFLLALMFATLPGSAVAAGVPNFSLGNSVLLATSTPANAYVLGGAVTVISPVKGDLSGAGGSVGVDSSVSGDLNLLGGSITLATPIMGDARLVGGRITIQQLVGGDLVAVGGSVTDSGGGATNVFIAAGEVTLSRGSTGPVTIYGNNVSLAGTFNGDVDVTAGGHVYVLPGAILHGELRYQAPQEADIASSAKIEGGVHYTGASYLPTSEEARAIALASFGVFLFVKMLGALILAGLVAGLFPSFVDHVVARATRVSVRRKLLTLLLGFGVLVATPVFIVLLSITFVGLGLAFILGLIYLLLIPISFIYAAIVIGSYLAHYLFKRDELRWSDAVLGMLALFLIWSIPVVGGFFAGLAVMYLFGVLTILVYRFAFPREDLNEYEG